MKNALQILEAKGIERIHDAMDLSSLEEVEQWLFGRKQGELTLELRKIGHLSETERKKQGEALHGVKENLEKALLQKKESLERTRMDALAEDDRLDITMDLPRPERGHLHLIPEFIRQVEDVFGRMGFDVAYGPEIEEEELNFDLLNIPSTHPARDMQDTFWMEGEKRKVLRTHTSPVQIRYMQSHKPPFRMVCPGKVYRKDADATHSPVFHQFEGLMIGKDVNLCHLKGVMTAAVKELISPDLTLRFRTGYFPFTEPSLEMDIQWGKGRGEGKWLEVAGCGMVHPQVLRNVNIDPEAWQGFAFGFGVERLLMIKHQIPNIRLFYQGDLRFLKQF
jgi:phenylalanyl-tRNA synthetase alpha chain